ncbi:mannitol dehydrogenase family protein [Demequina phytophila]|uniref:mannitol dehydrogenase family protein n=1 Tax=Demequina phytophila TaxID=1638981 RepID=UPI0007833E89|nr:mannitol dehydrogenase family protein [Demequina phytophila]
MTPVAPLSRTAHARPAAPVRIVHLGLGAFHRAHQAWYTAHADDAADWGIAAFTGRAGEQGDAMIATLRAQDQLYTLTLRGRAGDHVEVIDSIVAVHSADDAAAFERYIADPAVAIISTTVTEAGYRLDASGSPEQSDPVVAADLDALAAGVGAVRSPLALIARALDGRRRAGAGPITVMPCDNMPANGRMVRTGLRAFANAIGPALVAWIESNVTFVSTSVDRITPRFSGGDDDFARAAGLIDRAPVVAEEFADWVLEGDFVAGRPLWESAGARFVTEIDPFENRKLWLLNGAHTAMANLGRGLGLETVAAASGDAACRALVTDFWREASRHLPAEVEAERYCADLWMRFENPRIAHRLDQIAEDSLTKLRVRIVPVALAELMAGRPASGCARAIAAWISNILADGGRRDSLHGDIVAASGSAEPTHALLALVSEALAADVEFAELVTATVTDGVLTRRGAGLPA